MENNNQLEKKTKVDIQATIETIKRQRQLTCEVIEDINQLREERLIERHELVYLKTKTKQQQKDIYRLTAEKLEQHLLIKRLRLQVEESKNEATQEKMKRLKIQPEIYQERETLERRSNESVHEQQTFETIDYERMKSKESKELIEQIKRQQERLEAESLLHKEAKEEMEKYMSDTAQELKRNQTDISKHREQIKHIKHDMNLIINKMKQRRTKSPSDVQMHKAVLPEIKCKQRKPQGENTLDTVKMKLCTILKDMDKLRHMLEESDPVEVAVGEKHESKTETGQVENIESDFQKQRPEKEVSMKTTEQGQKQDIESKLAHVQSERDEIKKIETELQIERDNIERDWQLAQTEIHAMTCMRESIEREKHELENTFERTKKERRELEVLNTEIEMKKKDLVKMMKMSRRKNRKDISKTEEIEHAQQHIGEIQDKAEGQRSEQVLGVDMEHRSDNQKTHFRQDGRTKESSQYKENLFEKDGMETSKTENKVSTEEETTENPEQGRADFSEEKSSIKWLDFQAKKKRRELEQWMEKTMKEKDELEIVKIKIQRQKEEVQQKLEHTITTILTMGNMKAYIERVAAEMNNTWKEMLKAQRQMEENQEEVKKITVMRRITQVPDPPTCMIYHPGPHPVCLNLYSLQNAP
uniref:trichohyalin-like n=1 Tax=Semicossyphus pulcher TaxID=241346 RepID=UPI0037E8132B